MNVSFKAKLQKNLAWIYVVWPQSVEAVLASRGALSPDERWRAVTRELVNPAHSDTGDTMMMSLYFGLGIFLLIAVRNPGTHRSLIAFADRASIAHAAVRSAQGFEMASMRAGLLVGSGVLVVIGVPSSCRLGGSHRDNDRAVRASR